MFANRQLGFIYQTMKYLSYIPAHNNLITTKKIHYILFLHNNIYFNTSLFEYLISNIKITNVFVSPIEHDPIPQATTSHLLCCPTQSTTLVLTLAFDKALASGDTSTLENFTLRGLIRLDMVFTSLTIYMTVISKFSFMAYICNHLFPSDSFTS